MSLLPPLLIILLSTSVIQSLIYSGSCPHKHLEKQLVCKHFANDIYSGLPPIQFIPVLQLPIDNKTINIFHNPFLDQNHCIKIVISCSAHDFQFILECETHECEVHLLSLHIESTHLSTGFLNQDCMYLIEMLAVVVQWMKDIGTGKDYLLMWGCRDLVQRNLRRVVQHEEGAWLLKPTTGTVSKFDVNQSMLEGKTMQMLKTLGSAAESKDLLWFPSENISKKCACTECPDKKRCDFCLKEIYLLNIRFRDYIFAENPFWFKPAKNVVRKSSGCDYGAFFEKVTCFLHQIIKFFVT